jgi:hypothetical protein
MTTASTGAVATPSTGTVTASVSLASLLPKESLKLDRFEGLSKDRKFAASWVRRCEQIHVLLGYTDADWEKKLGFASASLPTRVRVDQGSSGSKRTVWDFSRYRTGRTGSSFAQIINLRKFKQKELIFILLVKTT